MLPKSVTDKIQGNVIKPSFQMFTSQGQDWKSDSMRIIPEEFVRSTKIEHRVVCSVRWGNSWQFWIERGKSGMVIWKQDWDEFVDTNLLGPNDVLFFEHQDTMFLQLRIFKNDGEEIIFAPEPETIPFHPRTQNSRHETATASASSKTIHIKRNISAPESVHPKPRNFHQETTPASASASGVRDGRARKGCANVKNPKRYLLNPNNPFFVKTLTKKNDVLYVPKLAIHEYGLKFGPINSAMSFLLPEGKEEEGLTKLYRDSPCFTGWKVLCRERNLKIGDSVVCELELSGGVVAAVRLHFPNK